MDNFFLSVHTDTTFTDLIGGDISLELKDHKLKGSLDNTLGFILVCQFLPILDFYHVPVHFTRNEEIDLGGAKLVAGLHNPEKDVAIVVDVDEIDDDIDCELDNVWGFEKDEIDALVECMEYWGIKLRVVPFNADPDMEDESWAYKDAGYKTFTFTIPVKGKFHTLDANIEMNKYVKAVRAFRCLLYYFIDIR